MWSALAASVGKTGRVVGVDISLDQIAAANEACAQFDVAQAEVQDVNELPYGDGSFDAIAAIQVIEYLDEPRTALSELRRVCSKKGRAAILATNWDTMFWNCDAPELAARIQSAWREHAPHPNLPSELRRFFADTGFRIVRQKPVTIINGRRTDDRLYGWQRHCPFENRQWS